MRWIPAKALVAPLFMLLVSMSEVLAQGKGAEKSGGKGGGNSGGVSAPEIDGPAGIAAIAILVCGALIAFNRYRK
jgi:hypothetical protein